MKSYRVAVVAAVPLSLRVFMRPHLEAMASHYSVVAICSNANELANSLPAVQMIDVDIHRDISPFADVVALYKLCRIFRREKIKLIHSLTPKAGLLAMLAGFFCRIPVRIHVFTGQVWVTRQGIGRFILKTVDRLIALLATNVLADSPSQRVFLVGKKIVSPDRIDVLCDGSICGVDAARFRPNAFARKRIRDSLDIEEHDRVVLFLGRLNRDKGVLDLAQAFTELSEKMANVILLFVGPDEEGLNPLLKETMSECMARVRFVEMTQTPEDFMAAADILALPSYREGFGSVILEAAACGVPAVASRIYGLTDAVEEGVTGLMHPPGSVAEIVTALEKLLQDEYLRRGMGDSARERALKSFSVQRIVDAQMEYYRRAIARRCIAAGGEANCRM